MDKKLLWQAGIAIAVVGAASVGVIGIASASGDGVRAAAQQTTEPDDDHWRGGPPWRGGPGPWGGGLGRIMGGDVDDMLHAEVVVSKDEGGTQTVLVQKGTVTEVSGTGVTVKSADGFTTAYAVNDDTEVRADSDEIGSVAKDEEVVVVAPKSGDRHTATVVVDLTDLGWN
jgi:hypothetical protein